MQILLSINDTSNISKTIEASRANNADVDIPVRPGLAYLPFQKAGIAYALQRPSTLICDEMGLGKTIQALGFINAQPNIQSILIVCPASLKLNWAREAGKWLVRKFSIGIAKSTTIPNTDILIINWDILKKNLNTLLSHHFDLLIADEVHYAKSRKAQRTIALKAISKNISKKIFLTGTPIVNRPIELFSILEILNHPLANNFWAYAKRYCAAHYNGWGWDFSGASHLDELQEILRSSIMVRRLKQDVLTELPTKRRQVIEIENGYIPTLKKERKAIAEIETR